MVHVMQFANSVLILAEVSKASVYKRRSPTEFWRGFTFSFKTTIKTI